MRNEASRLRSRPPLTDLNVPSPRPTNHTQKGRLFPIRYPRGAMDELIRPVAHAAAQGIVWFADFIWGVPLLVLMLGGGAFFLIYSRLIPYRYFRHAGEILSGKYDDPGEAGDIPHYQALSSALSGTLGMGNVAGVAVAITMGGPGAIFWMWASAILGVATKFFTCTLSIMYRGKDSLGELQGGPMYVIREGLGGKWLPLAYFFSAAGLIGTLPVFQINQLTQAVRQVVAEPRGWVGPDPFGFNLLFGFAAAAFVAAVIFGGIRRIGLVASRLVPFMVGMYVLMVLYVLAIYVDQIPGQLLAIVQDAWTGRAAAGGVLGVMILGIRRGAFSNEAGIGTEVMAHGAAKTSEPVREGMVAMLGPVIDTLIVCTCTALAILMTGTWQNRGIDGVTLTADAFGIAMPGIGPYLVTIVVTFLSLSTIFTYWYYGAKCLGFLIGAEHQNWYKYAYTALIVVGAVISLETVISLIDGAYALMAIPTMLATLRLSPRVMAATRDYFRRYREELRGAA